MLNQDKHVYSFMCIENCTYTWIPCTILPLIFLFCIKIHFALLKIWKVLWSHFLCICYFLQPNFLIKNYKFCVKVSHSTNFSFRCSICQKIVCLSSLSVSVALLLSDPLLPASSLDTEDDCCVLQGKSMGKEVHAMENYRRIILK